MQAVIFVGIQASGKSSFYQRHFFTTHIRINLDMLKTRHREAIFVHACIDAKQSFVVDNTNPTASGRARYIRLAKAAGFQVTGYYFESTAQDALRRNEGRPARERVPAKAIFGTLKRLEPPSLAEGFDLLYRVSLSAAEDFVVQDW